MVFIVEHNPNVGINCERIEEDECVNNYLTSKYTYRTKTYILGWDLFIQYMWCLNSYNVFHLTRSGYFYRTWNNSHWIVVEASDSFEAIEKAKMILDDWI